jgi:hypothetical protein
MFTTHIRPLGILKVPCRGMLRIPDFHLALELV